MIIIHKNNFFNDEPCSVAKKVIAVFFNASEVNISCKILTGGSNEAPMVRCVYLGISYIVKFFSSSESGKNEIAWTQHASDFGIGPKLYYADSTGKYMLIEFVKGNSLVPATANTPAIIKNLATSVARLHHSSVSFAHESDMFTRIDIKYKRSHCSGKLKEILENGLQHVKKIAVQLQSLVVKSVPCHNDLNPSNIFVNNNQVTLIDWGDAALGNPYYDIAAFFILNLVEKENEKLFFESYDKKLLNQQWQEYMQLYKQLVYFEFALNLLSGVQKDKNILMHAKHIPQVDNITYYLTILFGYEVKIDSDFLYATAIASINAMKM